MERQTVKKFADKVKSRIRNATFKKKINGVPQNEWTDCLSYNDDIAQIIDNLVKEIMEEKSVDVKEIVNINERWEKSIPHDKRSIEIFNFLKEYDFKFCSDWFCWKSGGDGDNGEILMYQLDEYFANKDGQKE